MVSKDSESRTSALLDLDNPQQLALGLAVLVALVFVFAASTSATAFGVFNPFWEGASQLQTEADHVGAESSVARTTNRYTTVVPNRTVAVVLSPDTGYSPNESRQVRRFVRQGGTLVVAEDFGNNSNQLLAAVGASARFNGSLLRDQRYNYRTSALPVIVKITDAPVTQGVDNLTFNHGTIVRPNGATVLARSSEFSYLDHDRNGRIDDTEHPESYPVVTIEDHGQGRIIAVADPSLFINLMLDQPGNNRFVRNLFLAHETVILDYSHVTSLPPLAVALLVLRDLPVLQFGLGATGLVLVWWLFRGDGTSPFGGDDANGVPFGGRTDNQQRMPPFSGEDVARYLEGKHPDWDDDRVHRVTKGIINRRRERSDDE
jgi:hypothetical protein